MSDNNKLSFRPVQGTEEKIKALNPTDGYVYFATDTKKIYCGKDGDFVPMGGNSGIYYGKKILTDEEKYDETVVQFIFNPEKDIEGNQIPVIGDLILNEPDGGFYKVVDITEEGILTYRLAIAGGGTTGPSGGSEGYLEIKYIYPLKGKGQVLAGDSYEIEFEVVATDSAGDEVFTTGIGTWKINGKDYIQEIKPGIQKFSIGDYLLPNKTNVCTLVLQLNTGGGKDNMTTKTWHIQCIDLSLEWERNYSVNNFITDSTFTLNWVPQGSVDCTTHIIIDGEMNPGVTYFTVDIPADKTGQTASLTLDSLSYGSHTIEMYLTSSISDKPTEPIKHEFVFIPEGYSSTILSVPFYKTTAAQYDTLDIPFMVYDPDTEKCNVTFFVNDEPIATDEYDRGLQHWIYTITSYGTIKLTIQSNNRDATKDIELVVSKTDLNIQDPKDYIFSLNALNFSSNDELRRWNSNGIKLEFSENFDWINGGLDFEVLKDGSIEKYIRVRQGTTMTIDYELFKTFNTTDTGGKNFKFCFKAVNCYDYEAPVLTCYDEKSQIGLKFDAQKAIFSTPSAPNFNTQYCENSYIEIETEIWPYVEDKKVGTDGILFGDRFLMFWVDGIPAGVKPYSTIEFEQNIPQKIVIGSPLCDVYVYCAKAYNRRLSENEHLNNFIADAPSVEKMIDRFNRNNILDGGDISYEKLVQANPNCHAYLYEVDRMTEGTEDEVEGCTYYELWKENNTLEKPYYKAENATIYAQGTSSAAYGVAAFNLRTDFLDKGKIYDKNNEEVSGWKVSENAIPIDLTCTKVNVASCENANNVVNQEWYNKFQPYHDAHRRKSQIDGKAYRDTMEFNSGVIFIKDNNKTTNYYTDQGKPGTSNYLAANLFLDTNNYIRNPYFKMYAVGNMGNDKKNTKIFHDVYNPNACCVEVKDNQNSEHWMTIYNPNGFEKIKIGVDDEGKDQFEGPYYEFRYSVKKCKAEDTQGITEKKQQENFLRLVEWFASCDPNPKDEINHPNGYTGEPLLDGDGNPMSITYGNYTFQGFAPPGYSLEDEDPTRVTLAGLTVDKYAGTYTNDTREYRIAKMLHECEDYLVMDSIVYHYLYITRHTMVDNVAKNTFWSTEDGLHWDLTKDYDNDTSDGNDNSGFLSYTYGKEFGDLNEDGKDVFNAANSVWITFIDALNQAQEHLFRALEGKGAWSAKNYLNEFNKHQSNIPERCWIYDYFRKYIRPRRLGLDEKTYLDRLEGGKKVHQRTQYETYQEFYMNSKYIAGTSFTDSAAIDIRLNKDPAEAWDRDNKLFMSFYIDCYGTIHLGGQKKQSQRLKRNQDSWPAPVGQMVEAPSDATCYIYGAEMVQSFSGLDKLYPGYAKLTGASKLRSIELGSLEDGYYNARLKSLDIGANAMLQKLQMQNCGNQTEFSDLTLDKAQQLQEVLLRGSAVKNLTLADGGATEVLQLNAVTSLYLSNLNKLISINLDGEDPEDTNTSIYSTIKNLSVVNCPAMDNYTYKFAKQEQISRYLLGDFTWNIRSIGEGYNLEEDFILDDNGYVEKLVVLENLMKTGTLPMTGHTTKTALNGNINIDVDCSIDEFDLYKRYIKTYPNLTFNFTNNVSNLIPAIKLIFYANNEDGAEIHYKVLASGSGNTSSIAKLTSTEGPLGVAITAPYKDNTTSHIYTFTKYWIYTDSNNNIYKYYLPIDFPDSSKVEEGAISFDAIIPTEDMSFYPEFIEEKRKYNVKFYNWDDSIIKQETASGDLIEVWPVIYDTVYNGPIKNFYYRDSSDLADEYRWSFKGWSPYKYGDKEVTNPVYVNPETLKVKENIVLYAHFVKEICKDVATDSSYFNFELTSIKGIQGYTINIKDNYREVIEGKITLPGKYNGLDVIRIGDFKDTEKITHIFCERNSKYLAIGDMNFQIESANPYGFQCLKKPSKLVKVDLSDSIIIIGDGAFTDCCNLIDINLNDNIEYIGLRAFGKPSSTISPFLTNMKVNISSLPKKLSYLGPYAFYKGGQNITFSILPDQIEILERWSLSECPNIRIEEFGVSQNSNLHTIDGSSLYGSGNGVSYIVIGSKVISLKTGVSNISSSFSGYGSTSGGIVIVTNGLSSYGVSSLMELGFSDKWQESTEGGI